ncbi:flagellar basal body P-ring protein FlgI [Gemmata sp.]|uniref:flagellar basal body P-ring protein FlgI n=1 Tax=Gemmata sp. TaxID=1914242 RepID=UPI003F6E584E
MHRARVATAGLNRRTFLALSAAAGLSVATGCKGPEAEALKAKAQGRSQIGEDPLDLDAATSIGSKTTIGNTESILVSGVGLVYGLQGTGSSAPPGGWRMMLEESLKRMPGMTGIKQMLDDPGKSTSLVLVSALVPPGARKGDPIDVQITLPDESKTTSLKGGRLLLCELFNTDTTGNLKSLVHEGKPTGPSGELRKGDRWAVAEGTVLAGQFIPTSGSGTIETDADGQPLFKVGKIWGGAKVIKPRQYFLLINSGSQSPQMAASLAERLNSTFHATTEPNLKVADAKTRELILLNVPLAYRNNHYRFLLVARQIPVLPAAGDSMYRKRLEEELLDPAAALTAAVKLEALGSSSMRALRVGLESPSPWVRFAAGEALTYLGQTDGAAELAKLAEAHPALRAPALKALAAMDDAACTDRLAELTSSSDPSLRYGAFIALRLADENNSTARGVLVNNSFWLHQLAPGSAPMIHLTTDRRCEIVLFGDAPKLRGPFTLPVGSEFTVSVPAACNEATVTRIVKVKNDLEEKKVVCKSTALAEVLLAIGRLGGGYAEGVELIRRADRGQVLSAAVVVDAVPSELNIKQLADFARTDPTLTRANTEVAKAGVVRPELDVSGFDLPSNAPETEAPVATAPARPPLNREPGRIFGKRHDAPPPADPGVVPAGGQ